MSNKTKELKAKVSAYVKKLWMTFRGKNLAWVKSEDVKCSKSTFNIKCQMCRDKWYKRPAMLLRNSSVLVEKQTFRNKKVTHAVCRMNYKCPRCDWVTAFVITWDMKDIQNIL